jgi:hypothetical protein
MQCERVGGSCSGLPGADLFKKERKKDPLVNEFYAGSYSMHVVFRGNRQSRACSIDFYMVVWVLSLCVEKRRERAWSAVYSSSFCAGRPPGLPVCSSLKGLKIKQTLLVHQERDHLRGGRHH